EGLAAVVAKMMAKKPERRYRTPAEAARALRPFAPAGLLSGSSIETFSPEPAHGPPPLPTAETPHVDVQVPTVAGDPRPVPPIPLSRKKRVLLVLGVVAATCLAGVVSFILQVIARNDDAREQPKEPPQKAKPATDLPKGVDLRVDLDEIRRLLK